MLPYDAIRELLHQADTNRTGQYPFASLSIGNYFTVSEQFQHARVAASEFGRKHGMVFSCRMQPEVPGERRTMRVYRVAADQARVDVRGRQGKRTIPTVDQMPTKMEFTAWLLTFEPGQLFYMPATYTSAFALMQAWCELASLKTQIVFRSALQGNGTLLIARGN